MKIFPEPGTTVWNQENPATWKIYKYSQLLFSMVKFTIVNSDNRPVWRSGYAVDCRSTTTRFESGHWLLAKNEGDKP